MNNPTPVPAADNVQPDLSGRSLGDYRVLRRLGRGGMADVYLAEQSSLRRRVALKVLRGDLAAEESYVRRFHNEAHAAAALVHANIVQIFEVGCVEGVHFIAQEYVEGTNLKQLVSRHGTLDVKRAVLIMRQVAAALHKAGKQGIIHRDIKPENILIGPDGEAKVADFGLARVTGDSSKLDLTQIGMTMGTPLYMSPEQVEGRPLDSSSDIYSLGVTCYHMLAGRPPFEGETALSVAVQHLKNQPPPLESLCPEIPPQLSRIVHKMLAKTPADRYKSAADLLRDLRQVPVEGLESDWSSGLLDLDTTEQLTLSDSPIEATRRLEIVMAQTMVQPAGRVAWHKWLLVLLLVFGLGCALAWATRPPAVLEIGPSEQVPGIPRMGSAKEQFLYAWWTVENTNPEAYESVIEFFREDDPQDKPWILRAKQQLARLYLANDEDELALKIFDQLAELDSTEEQFCAVGLAGQAIVYWHQYKLGKVSEGKVSEALVKAWQYKDRPYLEDMRDELNSIGDQLHQGSQPNSGR